jgi:hypothetical protein
LNIKLSWAVKRESGRPLTAADIDRYELVVTRDGVAVVVPPPSVPAPADTSFSFPASVPGTYGIGLVCVPKRGGRSDPATGSVEIFDESKVVIFDLTVEVVAP